MKYIVGFLLISIFIACEKDKISSADEIIGKWKIVQIGNETELYQVDYGWYYEFMSNNTVKQYSDTPGLMYTYEYQINDSLNIGGTNYAYDFHDNKMKLEFTHFKANYKTHVYQRIP